MLQEIEFLILINNLLGKSEAIQRFSSQTKYSLRFYIPCFGNRTAGRITFSNKNGRLLCFLNDEFLIFSIGLIIIVIFTITKFFVVKVCLFCPLVGKFLYSG